MAMDRCCTLCVKNVTGAPLLLRNSISDKPISWNLSYRDEPASRVFDIRFSKRRAGASSCHGSFVVRASKKNNHDHDNSSSGSGNGDQSLPEGDDPRGNPNKSNDTASQKSRRRNLDWREFRASLFAREQKFLQAQKGDLDARDKGGIPADSKPLGSKWAHPISVPEIGCVLLATEKLDGVDTFERTVILLLKPGTGHPQDGPFGVVINRPLYKQIKHMNPTNLELASAFNDCPLHFGGPLATYMFLLRSGENSKPLPGFEEVIPGLCYGSRHSLHEAARMINKGLLKPQDFRFFVGYAGWQLDQLKEEIESDYWCVAACSSNLICGGSSSEGLWTEILQLMGGRYAELSRKPKQDD